MPTWPCRKCDLQTRQFPDDFHGVGGVREVRTSSSCRAPCHSGRVFSCCVCRCWCTARARPAARLQNGLLDAHHHVLLLGESPASVPRSAPLLGPRGLPESGCGIAAQCDQAGRAGRRSVSRDGGRHSRQPQAQGCDGTHVIHVVRMMSKPDPQPAFLGDHLQLEVRWSLESGCPSPAHPTAPAYSISPQRRLGRIGLLSSHDLPRPDSGDSGGEPRSRGFGQLSRPRVGRTACSRRAKHRPRKRS